MNLSRRGFFRLLGALPVAVVLPAASKIWLPPEVVTTPAVVAPVEPLAPLIYGWAIKSSLPTHEESLLAFMKILAQDTYNFEPDRTILLLQADPHLIGARRGRSFVRFAYRGSDQSIGFDGIPAPILGRWPDLPALEVAVYGD